MVELLPTLALVALGVATGGMLAQRLRAPSALGYLLVGLVLHPFVAEEGPKLVGEVGILILLFLIGLELDLASLRKAIARSAPTLPFDLLLPLVGATLLGRFLGWSVVQSLALGCASALSSTLIGERLSERATPETRQRVLGILLSEDAAAGALLAFLAALATGVSLDAAGGFEIALEVGRMLLVLALLTAMGLLIVPRLMEAVAREHQRELLVLWSLAIAIFFAYVGGIVGSAELGALVGGVLAAESRARFVAREALTGVRAVALAAFLVSVGLAIDARVLFFDPLLALSLAGVVFFGKMLVHLPSMMLSGRSLKESWEGATSLATLGEFSFVIASVAVATGIANEAMIPALAGATIVLMPAATLAQAQGDRVVALSKKLPRFITAPGRWIIELGRRDATRERVRGKVAWGKLLASVLLVFVYIVFARGLRPILAELFPVDPSWLPLVGSYAIVLAVGTPVGFSAMRNLRNAAWAIAGLDPTLDQEARTVRGALIDGLLVALLLVIATLVAVSIPGSLPVVALTLAVSATLGILAFRRVLAFHHVLEESLGRVFGHDPDQATAIDDLIARYPWGLRTIAVPVPARSPVVRQTIEQTNIQDLTGAVIAAIHRGRQEITNPSKDTIIQAGDHVVILGESHQLDRAESLIVAQGEAIRLRVQTHEAALKEFKIEADNTCVGMRLDELRVKYHTGALITGIWQGNRAHPIGFAPHLQLHAGDRLLLLGTRLQLQRAKDLLSARTAPEESQGSPRSTPSEEAGATREA